MASGDRDEMFNYKIIECRKLVQKESKTKHNWVGKAIHREMCKRLELDHTAKCYVLKPKSILENKMHIILWDFEIQANHHIFTWKPDPVLINKKKRTSHLVNFAVPVDHWLKIKESEKY